MKELSIEEKARRYDEAIKRVENIKTGKCETAFMFTEGLFEHIFPELKESEDEKIKEMLIEQKSAWSEWDEKIYNLLYEEYKNLAYYSHSREKAEDIPGEVLGWLKSLKNRVLPQPKQEWSEEDERLCLCLIEDQKEALDNVKDDKYGHSEIISDLKEMYNERISWLKDLKERYTWKPSDAQIASLTIACDRNDRIGFDLTQLLRDLKKLKGE